MSVLGGSTRRDSDSVGGPSRPAEGPPTRRETAWAVLVVLAVAAGLAVVTVWAYTRFPPAMSSHHRTPQAISPHIHWVQAWSWWDGAWYVGIARRGYYFIPHRMSSVAFFPVYPLLVRSVSPLVGDDVLAGFLVSLGCGITGSVMFFVWTGELLGRKAARTALLLLLAYPCSFYLFGTVYADSVFLLLSVSAFVLLEHDHPGWAGLAAAVATATRPVGMALVIGLWVRTLERRGLLKRPENQDRSLGAVVGQLRPDAGVLLAPLGLVAYCAYLWVRFGNPLAFVSAEGGWRQSPGLRTWLKIDWFRRMLRRPYLNPPHVHLAANALVTLLALGLVGLVFRRVGAGYGMFVLALLVGSAVSTSDFVGMGRYVTAAFPLFGVLGERLGERPRLAAAVLVSSAVLAVVTTQLHARNMLIS
ncbi:MAG: hypothetical protein QOI99_1662 [Actinomycetota bacterium]|nr:hypothetical protein [Actinomycetota bacterium]